MGHEVEVGEEATQTADVAIVNLSQPSLKPFEAVRALKARGVRVLGHAGHKEKDLISEGMQAGCDRVVSNSELTFKLREIIESAFGEGNA